MRAYLQISGLVFGVVALLHVARLLLGWPAQIAGWDVPVWLSWLAFAAAGVLSFWAFRPVGQARPAVHWRKTPGTRDKDQHGGMDVRNGFAGSVGNTPLIRHARQCAETGCW